MMSPPFESIGGPILIGTSGYSFDDWEGPFYPPGTPKGKRLDFYVRHFPCVEINSTYYRIPHPAVMMKLVEKTPPGFEFTVKANEAMTHKRSRDPDTYRSFLECLEPMRREDRFHGVVLQFPWAFRNDAPARAHLAWLRGALPSMPLWAEFRHASWNRPEVYRFLGDLDLGFIAVDEPQLPEEFQDLLIHGTLLLEYAKEDDPRRGVTLEHYKRGLSQLKHHLAAGPDDLPVMGRPNTVRTSRLGPNFPAD